MYFNNIIPYFIIVFSFEMQDHDQKKIQSFLPILSSISSIHHLNFLYSFETGYVCVKLLQSRPTLHDPMDYNMPGSSVHGILQARILQWVAMPFSRGSSRPRMKPASHVSSSGRRARYHQCHLFFPTAVTMIASLRKRKLILFKQQDLSAPATESQGSGFLCLCG